MDRVHDVGTAGGESQPLATARAALEAMPDFLRPDAYLSIVIVTAHDDGSSVAVDAAAAGFKALKSDPSAVVMSVVAPANAPRLDALLGQFPNRSAHASIDDAKRAIAEMYPEDALRIGAVTGIATSIEQGLRYKRITQAPTAEQLATMFDIVWQPGQP